jgi:choline dehydrogenase-like flavoprotein
VLDEWATYHGTEGMRAADLAPWFEKVEDETHTRTVPDDAHSPTNRVILGAAAALGWSAFPARINAQGCVRTGFCGYGCRVGAKQDGLRTYLPRAQTAEARLLTNARAERIEFIERAGSFPKKRITLRHTPPGHVAGDIVVEAPVVIVAAGAVETPALLQRSALAGEAVGRYLRLHPTTGLVGFYDHEMYGAGGIPLSAVCDEFLSLDAAGYGSWIECPPIHPALTAAGMPGFGALHRDTMMRFANIGTLIVLTRDGARQGVSNGEVRARADGSVSIRYALDPADAAHMEAGLVAAARLHFAAGATEVRSGHSRPVVLTNPRDADQLQGRRVGANEIALFSAHVNGTCRMGSSRRTAGCDPNGEVFGAPGVFVADGSLLPTAPGVNPQETIMVLASLVAERISARRRAG